MQKNKKPIEEQKNLEQKRIQNIQKEAPIKFKANKEIKYKKIFPDNRSAFYYPLKKNFMSMEEEKKYNHYYGEEFVDRVSRIDRCNKKETYLQDDFISNLIFIYLLSIKSTERELITKIKYTFKMKSFSRQAIINRIKILYDRYHGYLDECKNETEFYYMSCKIHDKKNILTLFQNNKQLYCNIDYIYDCNFHSNIDPNFDNPSSYDQIKYLKSYKKLMEFSLYYLFGLSSNNADIQESHDMIIEEQSENGCNNEENIHQNNSIKNNINITINNSNNNGNNNNDLISNASSKILSISNSKEIEEVINEITIENFDGTCKIIYLNKKKELENLNLSNETFINNITDSSYEFNHLLRHIKCPNNIVSQIKKIKGFEKDDKKPCSELCYKNFLCCEEKLHNKMYQTLKDKQFPEKYELLFIKFFLIVKFDPCHLFKLMKVFLKDIKNFKLNCTDIYIHLLSKKFNLRKIIKKELFDLNLKERELSKKNKASYTPAQSKKIEENNLKNINLYYQPCVHFGNEVCDDKCLCSKRGFCEVFCRCNQILCKSAFRGCHCFKGDCSSNHCPCFNNGRECIPQRCKNCDVQNSDVRCKNLKLQMDYESKLIVGISKISGWGLFANEFIKKDCLIGEYKGELITDDIVNKRDKFREYESCTYMFKLDDEYTIDSRKMGNLLRYANHSKANSNTYPKIVFSEGQRKIVLIAKRNIFKGEEILFDYDGQGILGKQFTWINDEKKSIKTDNNLNIREKSLNNNSNNSKERIIHSRKKENISNNENNNNEIINIEDDESINNNEINNDINLKNKEITDIKFFDNNNKGTEEIINNINDIINFKEPKIILEKENNEIISVQEMKEREKDKEKDEEKPKENDKKKIKANKKEKKLSSSRKKSSIKSSNLQVIDNQEKIQEKEKDIEKDKDKEKKIEKEKEKEKEKGKEIQKNNLIDILSDKNYNNSTNIIKNNINNNNSNNNNINNATNKSENTSSKTINHNPKILFKTEEDSIFNIRNCIERKPNNIFDFMIKLGENMAEKNNKSLLNKKRNQPNISEDNDKSKINFNTINKDLINNENKNNILQNNLNNTNNQILINNMNNEKKTEANFEISNNENKFKLRQPLFVEENYKDSNINIYSYNNKKPDMNNIIIRNKIRYNFITCQNLNIIEPLQAKFDTGLNKLNTNNIFNKINFHNPSNINNINNNIISSLADKSTITKFSLNEKKIGGNEIKDPYNIGQITLTLELQHPIANNFMFFSGNNTTLLKNISEIKCKLYNLNETKVDINFDEDIFGYLVNTNANKGHRIFSDYLNYYDNMSYYCYIEKIKAELYILSKGVLFNKIKEKFDVKSIKNKKLLFFIKKK